MKPLHFFSIAAAIIILDQLTKAIVRNSFSYTVNTGTVLGFFKNTNVIFIVITAVVIIAIVTLRKKMHQEDHLPAAIVLGGAAGNLIDRAYFGGVIDFIAIGPFPAFNIADSALTIGALLLIYHWWRTRN